MIEPTVGRVVWYYEYKVLSKQYIGPMAAHIAFVHSTDCVNLVMIQLGGGNRHELLVLLVQDAESEPPKCNYCTWMPYQKSQAAKTEAAEAVAKAVREGFNS